MTAIWFLIHVGYYRRCICWQFVVCTTLSCKTRYQRLYKGFKPLRFYERFAHRNLICQFFGSDPIKFRSRTFFLSTNIRNFFGRTKFFLFVLIGRFLQTPANTISTIFIFVIRNCYIISKMTFSFNHLLLIEEFIFFPIKNCNFSFKLSSVTKKSIIWKNPTCFISYRHVNGMPPTTLRPSEPFRLNMPRKNGCEVTNVSYFWKLILFSFFY